MSCSITVRTGRSSAPNAVLNSTADYRTSKMADLSVAFLVRNPPMDRFSMLIEYLRVISNEIVIVDTGSEAADIAIMESWSDRFEKGVKVIETAWEDDFSK